MAIVGVCVQADPLHTTFAQSREHVQDESLGNALASIHTVYADLVNIATALGDPPKNHANRLILIPGHLPERLIEIRLVEKFLVLFLNLSLSWVACPTYAVHSRLLSIEDTMWYQTGEETTLRPTLALLAYVFLEEEQQRLRALWQRPVSIGEARREIQRRHRRGLLEWLHHQFLSGVHPEALFDPFAA
jgi:hypothetical protein